jgi:quinol monooxygenase YgiN
MVVEYIRYKMAPGEGEALLTAYRAAAESLRASPHCLSYELSRCEEAPESFVLRIEWDSTEGHLQGFRKSAEFGPFLQAVKPLMPQIEEMRHYARTDLHWAR